MCNSSECPNRNVISREKEHLSLLLASKRLAFVKVVRSVGKFTPLQSHTYHISRPQNIQRACTSEDILAKTLKMSLYFWFLISLVLFDFC